MTITAQQKGRRHIDYIREMAIAYHCKLGWKPGLYPQCIRDAMKEHREYLIRCEEEKKKIAKEKRVNLAKCQDCFEPLDQNDIVHYGKYCHMCFSVRFLENTTTEGIPIPMAPRMTPKHMMPKPRLHT